MKINTNISLFTIVAFSRSKLIDGLQYIIGSAIFRNSYYNNEINFELILERLNILGGRK
jgi:hypothetical protein